MERSYEMKIDLEYLTIETDEDLIRIIGSDGQSVTVKMADEQTFAEALGLARRHAASSTAR